MHKHEPHRIVGGNEHDFRAIHVPCVRCTNYLNIGVAQWTSRRGCKTAIKNLPERELNSAKIWRLPVFQNQIESLKIPSGCGNFL